MGLLSDIIGTMRTSCRSDLHERMLPLSIAQVKEVAQELNVKVSGSKR